MLIRITILIMDKSRFPRLSPILKCTIPIYFTLDYRKKQGNHCTCLFLCSKSYLRLGCSGGVFMVPSLRPPRGKVAPWWTFLLKNQGFITRYRLDELLPFSRQRGSLVSQPVRSSSRKARWIVERDRLSSLDMVDTAGQQ